MLSFLSNALKPKATKNTLTRDEIISLLKTSPETLDSFEKYYKTEILSSSDTDTDNIFKINTKQASNLTAKSISNDSVVTNIIDRIVDELINQTSVFIYNGTKQSGQAIKKINNETKDITNPVTINEIHNLPIELRPQLTGSLMKADIPDQSGPFLLYTYNEMMKTNNTKKKQALYNSFRQGLDILDLDGITYEIIGTNPNSMGNWLPKLISANKNFFKIPKTVIAKVPITLLQLTRSDYSEITATTKEIINKWAIKTFNLKPTGNYFIKTGTYSSKFDFRNCHVHDPKEITELGEYLLYIHFAALQMASPLVKPHPIYGASTTNEWVVREFIPDKENNPVIYKGLPLHTEYRVFIDCDTDTILGINPYWDPDTMKKRFDEHRDDHDEHDAIAYRVHESTLMKRYNENKDLILTKVQELLPDLKLKGQWSLDIMQNGNEFWLIDMAIAENSTGYAKAVKELDRRPTTENWLPTIKKEH